MADEWSFSWGNYDGRVLSSEPRVAYNNSPSYTYRLTAKQPWDNNYLAVSNASDALAIVAEDEAPFIAVGNSDRLFELLDGKVHHLGVGLEFNGEEVAGFVHREALVVAQGDVAVRHALDELREGPHAVYVDAFIDEGRLIRCENRQGIAGVGDGEVVVVPGLLRREAIGVRGRS